MLSREEREKIGWVGKRKKIDPDTGKMITINYDPEDDEHWFDCNYATSVIFSPEEWEELMERQSPEDKQ